jgi:hypothetical protein
VSSILVGLALTLAGDDLGTIELEARLSESATVSLTWAGARFDAPMDRVHRFAGLAAPSERELEYSLEVAGEGPRRFRVAPVWGKGERHLSFYLPGPSAPAAHELILDRIERSKPHLLVVGPEAQSALEGRVLAEILVWRPGLEAGARRLDLPGLQLLLSPHGSGPPSLEVQIPPGSSFRLPLASSIYERPIPAAGPTVRYETPYHLDLRLDGARVSLFATSLEGSRLDEVAPGAGLVRPEPRPWLPKLGLVLAAASFVFALLSLVLRRQVL